jgi:hypothetical protein
MALYETRERKELLELLVRATTLAGRDPLKGRQAAELAAILWAVDEIIAARGELPEGLELLRAKASNKALAEAARRAELAGSGPVETMEALVGETARSPTDFHLRVVHLLRGEVPRIRLELFRAGEAVAHLDTTLWIVRRLRPILEKL